MSDQNRSVDVVLLSGFLGSGKTSLIRRLVSSGELSDTALIINEFGEIGLDQFFVQTPVENTLLLENGCVCCSIRGDLIDTIAELFTRVANGEIPPFSRVLVETTGLADPGPIVAVVRQAKGLAHSLRLSKVIVTVDGVLGPNQILAADDAVAQITQADLCVVTKADLVDPNVINSLADDLRVMNPAARVCVLNRNANAGTLHSLLAPEEQTPRERTRRSYRMRLRPEALRHRAIDTWSIELTEPLDWRRFRDWLDLLYSLRASNLVRMKAILNIAGHASPVVVHGVGPLVSSPEELDRWPTNAPMSRIVVIMRSLSAEIVDKSFRALVTPGPLPGKMAHARGNG